VRHLITFPEEGSIALGYGCSECYWRYVPKAIDEVYEGATFWTAQVLFERHDCQQFKISSVPEPPKQAS
jgi:hypothetical protein